MKMKIKERGFTLVELLVVIAIIALLLAILMPALNLAMEHGRIVACCSNLSQINKALDLYMMTFDDKPRISIRNNWEETPTYWMGKLCKYMGDPTFGEKYEEGEVINVLMCPSAPASKYQVGVNVVPGTGQQGTAKIPWSYDRTVSTGSGTKHVDLISSLGFNGWLGYDDFYPTISNGPKAYKKYVDVPYDVPVFGDAMWLCGWPDEDDVVQGEVEDLLDPARNGTNFPNMWRFCIDRHRMKSDIAFRDGHSESIRLREFWSFPWHKDFRRRDTVNLPR